MTQQWQFVEKDENEWHWERTEDTQKSATTFSSATECMLDAVRFAVQRRRAAGAKPQKDLLH